MPHAITRCYLPPGRGDIPAHSHRFCDVISRRFGGVAAPVGGQSAGAAARDRAVGGRPVVTAERNVSAAVRRGRGRRARRPVAPRQPAAVQRHAVSAGRRRRAARRRGPRQRVGDRPALLRLRRHRHGRDRRRRRRLVRRRPVHCTCARNSRLAHDTTRHDTIRYEMLF